MADKVKEGDPVVQCILDELRNRLAHIERRLSTARFSGGLYAIRPAVDYHTAIIENNPNWHPHEYLEIDIYADSTKLSFKSHSILGQSPYDCGRAPGSIRGVHVKMETAVLVFPYNIPNSMKVFFESIERVSRMSQYKFILDVKHKKFPGKQFMTKFTDWGMTK